MRATRTITASLAAALGVAALAGPAAAGQRDADDSAKANVYVPPAAVYAPAPADDSAKANVYVPAAAMFTAAPANDSAKANVYVPPNPQPVDRHVPAASASHSGFDWGSAGIGAAAVIGALLIALCAAAELRRRRQIQPAASG